MVSIPLWALFAVAFGSPILAFLGVLLAQVMTRKSATELEARSKREETMRILRWAAELAVSLGDRIADLGVAQLGALLTSDLLDDSEKVFVEVALDAVYEDPEAELNQLGEDVEVIQLVATNDIGLTDEANVKVSSTRTQTTKVGAMAKKVFVSSAQKSAAQAMVNRGFVTGRNVPNSVRKIANAKVEPINGKSAKAREPSGRASATAGS